VTPRSAEANISNKGEVAGQELADKATGRGLCNKSQGKLKLGERLVP